jgi:hypothetical protein
MKERQAAPTPAGWEVDMMSLPKLLILVLVIAVVWFGVKAIGRVKASSEAKAKEGDGQE